MKKDLPDYSLYLVTDRRTARGRSLEEVVRDAVEGGVTVVQLREKDASTRDFLELAVGLKAVTGRSGVPLIINDRVDIALACRADGVHLGQDDMNCRVAREIVGSRRIIGVSVSSVEEAVEAEANGADYLGVSPIFDTPTKTDTPPATGLDGLSGIRRAVRLPLVAIGGINLANAAAVIRHGADGIAVVSAIMANPEPRSAARTLKLAIADGRRSRAACRREETVR